MTLVQFTGPAGQTAFVERDSVAGLLDMTTDPNAPLTNVYLKGGPGWLTVQGRPADVKTALEAAA